MVWRCRAKEQTDGIKTQRGKEKDDKTEQFTKWSMRDTKDNVAALSKSRGKGEKGRKQE